MGATQDKDQIGNTFQNNPEEAKIYGTDNLGLRVLPGYYFADIPEKRAANFFSQPMKLNVNGDFGRYIPGINVTSGNRNK